MLVKHTKLKMFIVLPSSASSKQLRSIIAKLRPVSTQSYLLQLSLPSSAKFSIIPCLYQEKLPKGGTKKDKCHRKCALDGPKSRKMPEILFR